MDNTEPLPVATVVEILNEHLGETLSTESLANDAVRRDREALGIPPENVTDNATDDATDDA